MAHLSINNKILDRYFGFLLNLDSSSKKRLINRLSESIQTEKKSATDLRLLFGSWVDEKEADEMINEIRSSRIEKPDITGFE
jgi:hypothetical protein